MGKNTDEIRSRWTFVRWMMVGVVCSIAGCSSHRAAPKADDSSTTAPVTATAETNETPLSDSSESRTAQSFQSQKTPPSSPNRANSTSSPAASSPAKRSTVADSTKKSDGNAAFPTVVSRGGEDQHTGEASGDRAKGGSGDGSDAAGVMDKVDTVDEADTADVAERDRQALLTELEASLDIAERKAMRENDYGGAYRLLVTAFTKLRAAQNERERQVRLGRLDGIALSEFSPELQVREAKLEQRLRERLNGYASRANEIAKRQMDLESDETPLIMQGL